MDSRKLESAALLLTVLGAMLIVPPLALLFQVERRVLGIPVEVIYLFTVWAGLIAGAWWLGRRLPREPAADVSNAGDD
jgi:hypothetical protein